MSASLVGSEMCIRDRFCPAPSLWLVADMGGGDLLCALCIARPAAKGWACLLYTSDAADDM
eukprot:8537021-Alexandrium_andersonii.AAC.1